MLLAQPPRALAKGVYEVGGWQNYVFQSPSVSGELKPGQTAGEVFAWVQSKWRRGG